jgi:CubicO group peptidase (beta-lactamase class C family)
VEPSRSLICTAAAAVALTAGAFAQAPPALVPEPQPPEAPAAAAGAPPLAAARLAPGEPIPAAELEAFVDGTVRLAMDQAHIAGAAVAVVQGGAPVLLRGYGFASFDPVRRVDPESTLFRIGSITKTFTWIAAMRAVEAGKLDLDRPINDYLPADTRVPDEGFARQITMRHLMAHSPGFEDRALGILFAQDPARVLPLNVFLREHRPERVREPGELSSYSNYGVALAGAAVAEIERDTWQALIERTILAPLRHPAITAREPYPPRDDLPTPLAAALAADLSGGFRWNGTAHTARSFEYITQIGPAGSMSASAAAMARYMLLLLNDGTLDGATVFGPAAAAAFRTPLTPLPSEVGALDAGFFESRLPGGLTGYGHNGGTLSFFTNMTVVPQLGLGVFVATNTEGGAALSDPLPARIVERFYAPPREPPAVAPETDAAELARVYAGEYLATRRAYSGLEGFLARVQGGLRVAVDRDGALLVRAGPGPMRMVPGEQPDLFVAADAALGPLPAIAFEREGGRAARAAVVPIAFERVSALYASSTFSVIGGLAVLTAVAVALGAALRLRRPMPATRAQRLAGRLQVAAALALLGAAAAMAAFGAQASDVANIFYDWPGALVVLASALALLGAVLTGANALLLPVVWRGHAAQPQWPVWRKIRFTAALAVFAACAILLAAWGALEPWRP